MRFQFLSSTCIGLLTTLAVSAQSLVQIDSSQFSTVRVDPSNAIGGNVSDVFKEVQYIPLETTTESLLGNVSQLEVLDGYFVILDYDKNAIFIFTSTGKYHAKIKGRQNTKIYKFIVNKWTNQIVFTNDNYQSMTYCDLDGKIVKNEKNISPNGLPLIYLNSYFISADQLLSYDQYRDIDTSSKYYQSYSRSLIRFGNPVHSVAMRYTEAESKIDVVSMGIGPLTTYGTDTTFFFVPPYDYSLYRITPNTIKLAYKFILPQLMSLPTDFLTNTDYDLKRIAFIQKNRELIFSLNNCYQIGANLLFETSSYVNSDEDNLLYNTQSGTLIAFKHILPDELSFFLPLFDKSSSHFQNIGFAYCDGSSVYTSISSLFLLNAKKEIKNKGIQFPTALSAYFSKGSAHDNPVIVRLKPKDEL